jgi:predicted TPR repeat methyltransferase
MTNEWDEYACDWDTNSDVVQYSENAFRNLTEVIELCDLDILDFGCGTGLLTEKMSPRANRIVALDTSKEMTRVLKNKNLPNVSIVSESLTSELVCTCDFLQIKFDRRDFAFA